MTSGPDNLPPPTRIIVADDHPAICYSMKAIFRRRPEFKIVADAISGTRAIELCDEVFPDVAIIDVKMPDMDGVETTQKILECHREVKVIAFSGHCDKETIRSMLRAGAMGFIQKAEDPKNIIRAVETVAKGHAWFSQAALDLLPDIVRQSA